MPHANGLFLSRALRCVIVVPYEVELPSYQCIQMAQQDSNSTLKRLLNSTAIVTHGSHSQGRHPRLSHMKITQHKNNRNSLGEEWLEELVERGKKRSVVDSKLRVCMRVPDRGDCGVVQNRERSKQILVLGGNPVQRVPRGESKIKKHFQRSKFKTANGRCIATVPETYNHYQEVYEDDDLLQSVDDEGARTEISKRGLGWEGTGTSTFL